MLLEERLGVAAHQQHRHLDLIDAGLRALAHRGLALGVRLSLSGSAVIAHDEHCAAVGMVVGVINQLANESPSFACAGRTASRAGEWLRWHGDMAATAVVAVVPVVAAPVAVWAAVPAVWAAVVAVWCAYPIVGGSAAYVGFRYRS